MIPLTPQATFAWLLVLIALKGFGAAELWERLSAWWSRRRARRCQ
jgi:hypothetical protein